MLVLSRQRDQSVIIGHEVEITVVDIRGDKVRLGINAPRSVPVHRKEVYEQIKKENQSAAQVQPQDLPTTVLPADTLSGPPASAAGPPASHLKLAGAVAFEPRLSLLTLGVSDLQRSINFYHHKLGFPLSRASTNNIAFLKLGHLALALYPFDKLAQEANLPRVSHNGSATMTLAHNVARKEDVDVIIEQVKLAGATIVKPPDDTPWGGRTAYFADPDNHLWEITWNPHFPFGEDGSLILP